MTTQNKISEQQIKDAEPRALNAYVYNLMSIVNQQRAYANRFGEGSLDPEDSRHIHKVDYIQALDLCKNLPADDMAAIEKALTKAQEAFNDVMDRAVGKQIMDIIAGC